jgi:hypothetical protein
MMTILLAVGVMAAFFALMSVRLLLVKDGEFKGTCATQSSALRENGVDCIICGKKAGETCQNQAKVG